MLFKNKKQQMFVIIWVFGAVIAGWFYYHWHITNEYVGIVEAVTHQVGTRESGLIRDMYVAIQDEVVPGQVLAVLDTDDLDEELSLLRTELSRMKQLVSADQQRYSLELERLRQQLNNSVRFEAEVEARKAELAGLNAEIKRLEQARKAGLGHSRDLSELIVKRDALNSFLSFHTTNATKKHSGTTATDENMTDSSGDILESLMAESREKIAQLERTITLVENRYKYRKVIAPCNGKVVDLFARSGDTIEEYVPVIAITESRSDYLNVFIPEKTDFDVTKGLDVAVFPVRSNLAPTDGVITFIHPGYTRVPDRLTVRGQAIWAHVVRVTLNPDHDLLPGEIVHVRIPEENAGWPGFTDRAAAKSPTPDIADVFQKTTISLPDTLRQTTRFEPSGLVHLESTGNYLLVSDDTGLPDTSSDHIPWLFSMDKTGSVNPQPIQVDNITSFNDIEAVTTIDDQTVLLVSSQNISRKNKRKHDRTLLMKVRHLNDEFTVIDHIPLMQLIMRDCDAEERQKLGLNLLEADGLPELNIEAAAYRNNTLYLGLKEPAIDKKAIIWRISDLNALFQSRSLVPGQLAIEGTVSFKNNADATRGISDLTFDSNGRIWILTTIPEASRDEQVGGLHQLTRFSDNRFTAQTVHLFPGEKPEGLCIDSDNRLNIVIDADSDSPRLYTIDLEKLQ